MDKAEIYSYLSRESIAYEVTEHTAAATMEDIAQLALPYPEVMAKNLFVREAKIHNYYLFTLPSEGRIDLKAFRKAHGLKPLTFAGDEELYEHLRLRPGSVSPLGLLNDPKKRVKLFLDRSFLTGSGRIGVHPNDNTATLWLQTSELIELLEQEGHPLELI